MFRLCDTECKFFGDLTGHTFEWVQLSGDLEIRIPCTHVNNPLVNRIASIGIGDIHLSGCPTIEMMFYENTLKFSYFSDSVTLSSKSTLYDATSIVSTDVFGLKRTGEVFSVTKNGTTVATLSSVTIPALFAKKNATISYIIKAGRQFKPTLQ